MLMKIPKDANGDNSLLRGIHTQEYAGRFMMEFDALEVYNEMLLE